MKKIFLSKEKNFYKANLHCHSTVSDGSKTPEELKEMYMQHGYSVIAYTDHDVLIPHGDLTDDKFLALNGYEMEINEKSNDFSLSKTCHLCYIALDENNLTQVCYHRELYLFGNAPKYRTLIKYDDRKADFVREYTPDKINEMIKEGRDNGFFVTYNHAVWSLETLGEYGKYRGMNAMEICNYGCMAEGYSDYNEKEYDDMLRGGERIYCIATDDNHNYREDSFGGFTVINADKLEYGCITAALTSGDFYASQGPEIYELWYEDGKIGIECSDCASIVLSTGRRRADIIKGTDKPLTSAVFDTFDLDNYVRITVTDLCGKHANTNAYFVDELKK